MSLAGQPYILKTWPGAQSGELFDYIVEKGRLLEDEARHFFQQVLRLRAPVLFSMAAPASVKSSEA